MNHRYNWTRVLWLITALFFTNGCATGSRFKPLDQPADAALIYLYRPSHYAITAGLLPNAASHQIFVNGTAIAELRNGAYYPYIAQPGTNVLGSSVSFGNLPNVLLYLAWDREHLTTTNFEVGKTYYVRFSLGAFGPKMTLVDENIGIKEIQDCRLNTAQ